MIEQHYLDDCLFQLRKLKAQADKAMAQVDDAQFFALLDPDANSIALIIKHVAGNMRSRWTDFLTSDGEKPDRHRDSEFEREAGDTREAILARWEAGWELLFETIDVASARRSREDRHHPRRAAHGRAGDQPAGVALLRARRPDRAARQTLRGPGLADAEHPEEQRRYRRLRRARSESV